MEVSDKYACHIHGIIYSDGSDSDLDTTEFDEDYWLLKPPPYDYESIKDKIVVIPASNSKKIKKPPHLIKNTNEQKICNVESNIASVSSGCSIKNGSKKKKRKKKSIIQHQVPEEKQEAKRPVNKVIHNPTTIMKTETCFGKININEQKIHIVKSNIPRPSIESEPKRKKKRKKKSVTQHQISDKKIEKKSKNMVFDDPTASKRIEARLKEIQNVWHSGYTATTIQQELNILKKSENDGKQIKTSNNQSNMEKLKNQTSPKKNFESFNKHQHTVLNPEKTTSRAQVEECVDNLSKGAVKKKKKNKYLCAPTELQVNSIENTVIKTDSADHSTGCDSFKTENKTSCLFDDGFRDFIQQIVDEGNNISALNAYTYEQIYNAYMNYKQEKDSLYVSPFDDGFRDFIQQIVDEGNDISALNAFTYEQINNAYINYKQEKDSIYVAANNSNYPYQNISENENKPVTLTDYDNRAVTLKKSEDFSAASRDFYNGSPYYIQNSSYETKYVSVSHRDRSTVRNMSPYKKAYIEGSYYSKKPYFNNKKYDTIVNKQSKSGLFEALKMKLQSMCREFGRKILEQLLIHFVLRQQF